MKLYIVSGISGAGKSMVLNTLEDLGFYCIDNLPARLLPAFAQELEGVEQHYPGAAVGIDARNPSIDVSNFPTILEALEQTGLDCQILFVDAADETLITRFSETRRRHPLTAEGTPLPEAIAAERKLLAPISSRADLRIDTSHTNVHQLRNLVRERIGHRSAGRLSILFESFGYKNGIPVDADFVFDVRCLPNPHWVPALRSFTGRDPQVVEFLGNEPLVGELFEDIASFLERWIPRFEAENRAYVTVAIGCTGGQHRSVYFAERLAEHFRTSRPKVLTRHRELP